ncbi:MAG: hypothetical protein A4S09_02860 [Proteobacteria bacterium SG_bin7]|nr:MAG: hypothetical protein A4S09_02860 [Proteobacteria bacterium SG_bin7]
MYRLNRLFILIVLVLIFLITAESAEVKKKRRARLKPKPPVGRERPAKPIVKKPPNKEALVVVEGAMVYSSASFDAPVVSYLPANKKIEVSSKTYGPFYRVKIKKGSYGFISDVDLQILGESTKDKKTPKNQPVAETKAKQNNDEGIERFENRRPIDEVKAMGLNLSSIGYSEKLPGDPSSNVFMLGLKFTGPGLLLTPPMDVNVAMSMAPPSYYGDLAVNNIKPAGYLIYTDALLQFPFLSTDNTMVYFGLGPFITYLNAKVVTASGIQTFSSTRFGVEAMIGMGIRSGKVIVRTEGRYFYEGSQPFYGATIGLLYAR